jgi:hypothetical protein
LVFGRKTFSPALSIAAVSIGLLSGATAAIAATTYPAEGGIWAHGVNSGTWTTFSNYLHGSRSHGSTACNGFGACQHSGIAGAGQTSFASVGATLWGNKAYYNLY